MSDMQATHADYMKTIDRLEANNATGRGLRDGLRAKVAVLESELTAANAALLERDERITRLETALRKIILHFQETRTSADPRMHQLLNEAAIILTEKRAEAGHE